MLVVSSRFEGVENHDAFDHLKSCLFDLERSSILSKRFFTRQAPPSAYFFVLRLHRVAESMPAFSPAKVAHNQCQSKCYTPRHLLAFAFPPPLIQSKSLTPIPPPLPTPPIDFRKRALPCFGTRTARTSPARGWQRPLGRHWLGVDTSRRSIPPTLSEGGGAHQWRQPASRG